MTLCKVYLKILIHTFALEGGVAYRVFATAELFVGRK